MENILGRLKRGDVIVGDGALGTMLMQRGLKTGESPETYNLKKPEILEEIASLYLDAGSEIISTNTFGASPMRLQQFSLDKETEAINRSAVEAVRRAVRGKAYVSASVGPSAKMLKPHGNTEPEEIYASFHRQLSALLAAGIDMVCIETVMDLKEAALAIKAARSLDSKIPIMATVTFGKSPQGYFTLMGTSVKDAAEALEEAGADIIGSNCGEWSHSNGGDCAGIPTARACSRCHTKQCGPAGQGGKRSFVSGNPGFRRRQGSRDARPGSANHRRMLRHNSGSHPRPPKNGGQPS